jgi:hypothetical protein
MFSFEKRHATSAFTLIIIGRGNLDQKTRFHFLEKEDAVMDGLGDDKKYSKPGRRYYIIYSKNLLISRDKLDEKSSSCCHSGMFNVVSRHMCTMVNNKW